MFIIKKMKEKGIEIDMESDLSNFETLSQETRKMENLYVFLKQYEGNKVKIGVARDSD